MTFQAMPTTLKTLLLLTMYDTDPEVRATARENLVGLAQYHTSIVAWLRSVLQRADREMRRTVIETLAGNKWAQICDRPLTL